jgi:hypothetical protein
MRRTPLDADAGVVRSTGATWRLDMHPWITEALAREHVADLRGRAGSAMTVPRPRRRRAGEALGMWLVHLGLRLAAAGGSAVPLSGEVKRA